MGSPKMQIIFHKRATKYRSLLRKVTYKDKGSYESLPSCIVCKEVCTRRERLRRTGRERERLCVKDRVRSRVSRELYLSALWHVGVSKECTNSVSGCVNGPIECH